MVQRLEYIDVIARQLGRDVLFIGPDQTVFTAFWHETTSARSITEWLDQEAIQWKHCGPPENSGWFETAYIYVNVLTEIGNPQYQTLCAFLDDADGCCKWPETNAWVLTFESALIHAK